MRMIWRTIVSSVLHSLIQKQDWRITRVTLTAMSVTSVAKSFVWRRTWTITKVRLTRLTSSLIAILAANLWNICSLPSEKWIKSKIFLLNSISFIMSNIRITRGQKVESISNLVSYYFSVNWVSVWMFQIRMPWRWFLQLSTVVRNVKGAFLLMNNLLASSKERLCKTLRVLKNSWKSRQNDMSYAWLWLHTLFISRVFLKVFFRTFISMRDIFALIYAPDWKCYH